MLRDILTPELLLRHFYWLVHSRSLNDLFVFITYITYILRGLYFVGYLYVIVACCVIF